MAKKNRKTKRKIDLQIAKHKAFHETHRVTVVVGTGDKDFKFPESLPKCIHDKLAGEAAKKDVDSAMQLGASPADECGEGSKAAANAEAPGCDAHPAAASCGMAHHDKVSADWKQALPMVESHGEVTIPAIKITSCFGCFSKNRLSKMPADLFVVTVMHNAQLAGPFQAVDQSMGGQLSEAIEQQGFKGRLGERFLLDLTALQRPQRYMLVVGLGDAEGFGGHTACGLFRLITDVAARISAKSILLPVPPRRLSSESVSLRGTGAILRCRLEERALRGELGNLEKFEFVCSPQARRFLEEGIHVEGARCQSCSDPQLPIIGQ